MNKEEFILKASDLLEWEKSLKEREHEINKFEEKMHKEAYETAASDFEYQVTAANKQVEEYKLALRREQKAHADTRLDIRRGA
jgi:hypothetical protein